MEALVVFESMFGNSEHIAREIAAGVAETMNVEVRDATTDVPGARPERLDLLIVGGPTHAFAMSRRNTRAEAARQGGRAGLFDQGIREWLAGLPHDLHALPTAAFDTRVTKVHALPGSAAHGAARALRRHGGRMVVPPESFYVSDTSGPLEDPEPERAREWGRRVARLAVAQVQPQSH